MTPGYLARRAAREHPTRLALDDGSRRVSVGQLLDSSERFANALDRLGVAPDARVGIISENRTEYIEVDIGIALSGRVRVALNARLSLDDFRYCLRDSDATVLVHSAAYAEAADTLAGELGLLTIDLDDAHDMGLVPLLAGNSPTPVLRKADDDAPAWITYTSGTTGRPKGVTLSNRAMREVTMNLLLELGPREAGEGIVLTQPLSHGAGYFVLPYLLTGGPVRIVRRFDPEEVIAASDDPCLRTLKIVPAMLPSLLEVDRRSRYDSIVYGASPIALPLLEAALERFGPVLVQIYGQSECPVTLTVLDKQAHLHPQWRKSAGRPWRSVALEVRSPDGSPLGPDETGEVTVAGPHMMSGYWGMPEATAEVLRDGWLWTRDMGYRDDAGYVYLLGRIDEIINSGGFNISPREVEQAILEHPGVDACAVIGVPDDRWGNAVNALVRTREAVAEADLLTFAKRRLGFRTPKRIVIVREIPTNAYGKVDRDAVLAALTGDMQ